MSLKTKLLLLVTLSIAASIGIVAWVIQVEARGRIRQMNQQRTDALVAQFHREFESESEYIKHAVETIAAVKTVSEEMAYSADFGPYWKLAKELADNQRLDILELLAPDGAIISSAHWPARFGYKERWFLQAAAGIPQQTFLQQVETPLGNELGILCVRTLRGPNSQNFYVIGGGRFDSGFLRRIATPAGMRILIYSSPDQGGGEFFSSTSDSYDPAALMPLVQATLQTTPSIAERPPNQAASATLQWNNGLQEVFYPTALPGFGNKPAAVLLVGNSLQPEQELEAKVAKTGLFIALAGIAAGLVLGGVIATHITGPVQELADAAAQIGAGHWQVQVAPRSRDEIGRLAEAFNHMTSELIAQKERLVQSERVAAWRELARRLAHELKNPLFPLQLTVENLLRARETSPEQFDEVFRESTSTLLAEISNLKTIIGRFSDFSKMPAPQLQPVDLNELIRGVARLFQGQFQRENGRIETVLELDSVPPLQADPVLLRRVMENLVLNAIDAMPQGGRLAVRTSTADKYAKIDVSDTGSGLTPEECERLFTPYYTSKLHGTGLGLAIVQSVISDHHGRITVSSRKNEGTTFHIELPLGEQDGAGEVLVVS